MTSTTVSQTSQFSLARHPRHTWTEASAFRNEPVVVAGLKLREQVVNRSPHLGKLLDERRAVHYRVIRRYRDRFKRSLFYPRFRVICGPQQPSVPLTRRAIWKGEFLQQCYSATTPK